MELFLFTQTWLFHVFVHFSPFSSSCAISLYSSLLPRVEQLTASLNVSRDSIRQNADIVQRSTDDYLCDILCLSGF